MSDVHNPFSDDDYQLKPEQPANPYQSPMTDQMAYVQPKEPVVVIASQGKRFVNLIIDNIVLRVVGGVIGFAMGVAYGMHLVSEGRMLTDEDEFFLNVVGFGLGLVIALLYFMVLEGVFNVTVGKMVTKTRVVTESGGRPHFGQIAGRAFARFIPFEAFSFLGSKNPIGWHDRLSGTRVIEVK